MAEGIYEDEEKFNKSDLEISTRTTVTSESLESSNDSVDVLPPFKLPIYVIHYFLTGVCMVIVVCDIIAVHVLCRCKRVPYQCLQLSISYLLSDIVGMILFIIHELLIFGFGINTDIAYNSRVSTVALMHNISSASMAVIILERVFALKANLKYTLILKNVKIHLVNAVVWLSHILVTCCIMSFNFYFHCNWTFSNCDITEVNKVPKYYFLALEILYDVIMVFANGIIYQVARRQAMRIDAMKLSISNVMKCPGSVSERQYASIVVFMKIVTAYLSLQTPIIVTMVISTNYPALRDQTPMRVIRSIAYLCILMNSFVNLYLYIWKIKECKMNLFKMLANVCKTYEFRAEVLRIEVFNIVTSCDQGDTDV